MIFNTQVQRARILLVVASTFFATVCAAGWPDGTNIAVTITFDLDAETVWWDDAEAMTGNPSSLSSGRYGPTVAVPKILSVLKKHNVTATFFIPAWVAEHYPDTVRSIVAAGHEIAAHGVKHISPTRLTPAQELATFKESKQVLQSFSGKQPEGYRAPSWAFSNVTLQLAADEGFTYSSNRMDSDLPYVYESPADLVELPVSWVLDDAPFFWFDENSWNKKIHSAADVKAIWQEEFSAAYENGGYFGLTMHPQIIGRPARIRMLEEFIVWMKQFDGVWIASCSDVAASVREN